MPYRVTFDNDGLNLADASGVRASGIRWDDVYRATAFKIDAKTKQIAFLTFDFSWGDFVEVTDQTNGFADLLRRLHEFLELLVPDAVATVGALRPGNEITVLFQRQSDAPKK